MTLDYNSLLTALAVSATCLAITLLASWIARRTETFLLACGVGLILIVSGIVAYGIYVDKPNAIVGTICFALLFPGFATVWGAGFQFRTGALPHARIAAFGAIAVVATSVPILLGYDGLSFIIDNIAIASFLFATAYQYWRARAEAIVPLTGITSLYCLTAFSFVLCAAVLIYQGKLVLGAAPDNWSEDLSLAVCIASMTGIGALSLALHQWRMAARHRIDAATDPLTGLLNRRALFDRHGAGVMGPTTAVLVFDIDHFKSINDNFGHTVGDRVLKVFAAELTASCRLSDTVARLGGEEFAMVLHEVMPGRAEVVAERIRKAFEGRELDIDGEICKCTVSVGVASGRTKPLPFDAMLTAADKALYAAKRAGRNRVELASHLQAVPTDTARTAS
ncbi:GGDEF domain-containing protein [Rhizobium sp. 16-449-1b]|uniref:GGDEF domain-containing protein n=1 Tax=Rhizobium sp. 16-449-1b TaxID=2819989 RepID=UPI001AD9CA11|nr:GGDEF domain-containing protein [Rhizobium sp. 16-449-1b]MBO9192888.1 GGDEF domain-containing protein [Rhizobium sp. 16-449-1b]